MNRLITVIVLAIMIGVLMGCGSNPKSVEPQWSEVDAYTVSSELFNTTEDAEIPAFNFGSKVYIISDPNEEDPYLSYNMQKLAYTLQSTSRAVVDACDREEGCPEQTPIKNCVEDAVYLKVSEENKIYKEDRCVVIEGDKEGMAKAVDKLNLGLVGLR